ncbi:MAG: hypothetical protein KGL39_52795 [Patescibacteria group bacterium]|nr:hypothetical protein [Patescibacteria group bacterium]
MNFSRFTNPANEPGDDDRQRELEDEKADHEIDIAAEDNLSNEKNQQPK